MFAIYIVHDDQTLHIPSSSSFVHAARKKSQADSGGGSVAGTASRGTSIDSEDLNNSRAGLDPVTQVRFLFVVDLLYEAKGLVVG